jgi:hypothetical protein
MTSSKWTQIKTELLAEARTVNWCGVVLYIIALALLFLVWNYVPGKTAKIIAVWGFVTTQLVCNLKMKEARRNAFLSFVQWAGLAMFVLLAIAYSAAAVQEYDIAAISLLVLFFSFLVGAWVSNVRALWKSDSWVLVVIAYPVVSFTTVAIFAFLYSVTSGFPEQAVIDSSGQLVKASWDLMYFSSSVFYSNAFGDMLPHGYSKLITQIELAFSAIIHVIVLGMVVARMADAEKEKKKRK